MMRRKLAGAIICGGADSMISHPAFLGFSTLGALSSGDEPSARKCKPCDLRSNGTVLGEASVAMLMEDSDNVPDDIEILAEIVGYGCSMDSFSVTDPEPTGTSAAAAVRAALDEAGISAARYRYRQVRPCRIQLPQTDLRRQAPDHSSLLHEGTGWTHDRIMHGCRDAGRCVFTQAPDSTAYRQFRNAASAGPFQDNTGRGASYTHTLHTQVEFRLWRP